MERSQAGFTKGFAIGSDGDAAEGGQRENVYRAHREIGDEEEGRVSVLDFIRSEGSLTDSSLSFRNARKNSMNS